MLACPEDDDDDDDDDDPDLKERKRCADDSETEEETISSLGGYFASFVRGASSSKSRTTVISESDVESSLRSKLLSSTPLSSLRITSSSPLSASACNIQTEKIFNRALLFS